MLTYYHILQYICYLGLRVDKMIDVMCKSMERKGQLPGKCQLHEFVPRKMTHESLHLREEGTRHPPPVPSNNYPSLMTMDVLLPT